MGFLQKTITDYQKELTALAKLGVVKSRREENESIWRGHEIPSGFPTCRASLVKRLAKGAFRRPPAKPFVFPSRLLNRHMDTGMYRHLLIATDGSELANKAVEQGLSIAKAFNAKVTIVTVTEPWMMSAPGEVAVVFPVEQYEKAAAKRQQNP